jgi:hypothetical protein
VVSDENISVPVSSLEVASEISLGPDIMFFRKNTGIIDKSFSFPSSNGCDLNRKLKPWSCKVK